MPLYTVAIIKKPTPKAREDGALETMVLEPTSVIARDDKSASLQALLNSKDKIGTDVSDVEVLVRPF